MSNPSASRRPGRFQRLVKRYAVTSLILHALFWSVFIGIAAADAKDTIDPDAPLHEQVAQAIQAGAEAGWGHASQAAGTVLSEVRALVTDHEPNYGRAPVAGGATSATDPRGAAATDPLTGTTPPVPSGPTLGARDDGAGPNAPSHGSSDNGASEHDAAPAPRRSPSTATPATTTPSGTTPAATHPPADEPQTTPSPKTSAPKTVGQAPTQYDPNTTERKTYQWNHAGQAWQLHIDIPRELLQHYTSLERPYRTEERPDGLYRMSALDVHVTDPDDDAWLAAITADLTTTAHAQGWNDWETLAFMLAFVQSLGYTTDQVTTGFDEYPRYPIETLHAQGGDCEDTSILLAALARELGHESIFLLPPNHVGVGFLDDGAYDIPTDRYGSDVAEGRFSYQGDNYLYAETTGEGWPIGGYPADLSRDVDPMAIHDAPLYQLVMELGEPDRYVQPVHVTVDQPGSVDAHGVRVQVGFEATDGSWYALDGCSYETLARHQQVSCTVWLDYEDVPKGAQTRIHASVSDATSQQEAHRYSSWGQPWT